MRRRGRFGRKASVALRSVYPVVLGLGGWFLGVLVALATMPGVPLDDVRLAALSIGLPIGLGVYLAWVMRPVAPGRPRLRGCGGGRTRRRAGSGSTPPRLLALITTILGATAGANLALLTSTSGTGAPRRVAETAGGDARGAPLDG